VKARADLKRKRLFLLLLLLSVVAAGVYGWRVIRRGFSARQKPSVVEEWMARAARSLAVPASMREVKNPQAVTAENIQEGLQHFADHCAVCHANNGSGDTQFGRGMYPKPPDMRTAVTQSLSDGEIYSIIQNGVRLTGMPAFGSGRPDDSSTWNLVLFIRHLPRLTPEEETHMQGLNPRSREEWEELREVEDFLNQEDSPRASKSKSHSDHKH
jgi:mono/diheme cytochrome c family protein